MSTPMKSEYPYSAVSTVEGEIVSDYSKSALDQYPGQRRRPLPVAPLQSDRIFIKTAGNALQAVPRAQLEEKNLIAVSVPGILKPGDDIFVSAPDGRMLRATIPDEVCAGQVFFVQAPPSSQIVATGIPLYPNAPVITMNSTSGGGTQVVAGEDLEQNELTLVEEGGRETSTQSTTTSLLSNNNDPKTNTPQSSSNNDPNLILVQVPFGTLPGSKIHVKGPDGRTIEAQVPADPNVKEFYLRIPSPKPWHDSPWVVASAAATPYFA